LEWCVADQVGEIERMSRLRRFLPQQVADLWPLAAYSVVGSSQSNEG
jgi:hypothetical protein